MKKVKVIKVSQLGITFDNGTELTSYHSSDCCESHYLSFNDLFKWDFAGLEFDLDNLFERIPGYGIELIPIKGWSVKIPGYAENNGYYSANLHLILTDINGKETEFDISECQDY